MNESSDIGRRLRQIRHARGKSLAVIAGLAGISEGHLSRLEHGERSLDRHSLIVTLANALEIAPSELTALPVPAPGNGGMDSASEAVQRALLAASVDRTDGHVQPVEVLRTRLDAMLTAHYECEREHEVGAALPGLITDMHTSIAAGRDVAELLDLCVLLHSHATIGWLRVAGAPAPVRAQAVALAHQAAQRRDTPEAMGLAVWSGVHTMLISGAFDLVQRELDALTVPKNTPESTQLAGMLALSHALIAAADSRPGDMAAPLREAAELAEHTGEGTAYWLGFGPTNVGQWHMYTAREAGDHKQAAAIAAGLQPQAHPLRLNQADYWADHGRSLARLPGRRDDAVRALRRAERISPRRIQRDQFARDTLSELLTHTHPDAVRRELRGMAYRAGLPV